MSDLEELKELLFGAEKQALDSIAERVESREIRAADVADVLPEAVHRSYRKDGELVESLTQPVGECLQQAFRDDPETYGDALYPVMGPAIRKSIMHALRGFAQQINEAVEHSVSPKGLKWRWQASRAGIPFGEFVLQKTLLFRVEQAYLISRENGLLVGHVHHESSKIKDSDAVSAMFTAIQDFVKESFSPDRTGRLESADMGEFTLWAVHGPHALLVCVIRGVPPRSLRGDLSAILERIHFRYGDAIKKYKGDTSSVPEVESELGRCLRFEARQEKEAAAGERRNKRRLSTGLVVFLLLLMVGAAYLMYQNWRSEQQLAALESALANSPGVYVASVEREGRNFAVTGLQDPLATPVAETAASAGIAAESLSVTMQAFQSLAPEMIALRAERAFDWPASVEYRVAGSTLVVSGEAPADWRGELETNYLKIAGIDTLDLSQLRTSDAEVPVVSDAEELTANVADLEGQKFFFNNGLTLVPDSEPELQAFAAVLAKLQQDAQAAGFEVRVSLVGSTDGAGAEIVNARLARDRATLVAGVLESLGVEIASIRRATAAESDAGVEPEQRYVAVELELVAEPSNP